MRRRWWMLALSLILVAAVCLMTGCQEEQPYGLSAKDPVTVTVWHYYNGILKEEFDKLVQEFNETEGLEKGIIVEAYNKGSIDEVSQKIKDSMEKQIGSEPLPDVFAAYADKVYEIDRLGMAVDISQYMTEQEESEYVEAYIEEGRLGRKEGLKVFPVAKSTEVLAVNKTDWNRFAQATGETEAAFATWEGITRVAEEYYKWSGGNAFFGRDAFANYMIIGSLQLGHEIFKTEDGKTVMDFDQTAMRRLWDNYYVPYVNGYFAAYGRFRSDDVKTGKLAAFVGSTSGLNYFPTSVTLEDGTSYSIESSVYPLPNFAGTSPYAVQQGAGMMIMKSEEKREYAAAAFLKWFTQVEHNIRFCAASGYLPVKKAAGVKENLEAVFAELDETVMTSSEDLMIGLDTANKYHLYTSRPFENGDSARAVLNSSMTDWAEKDAAAIEEFVNQGMSREDAVAGFVTDENFEAWFEDTRTQLEAIVGA